jgi:hypothetical protein
VIVTLHELGIMDKSDVGVDAGGKAKRSWPLWKKIAIIAVVLVVAIALAVGLGVGLTRGDGDNNDGDDDSDSNGNGNEGGNGSGGNPGPGRNQTVMWQPEVSATWQIVLKEPIKVSSSDSQATPDVDIYDLDLFDNDVETFQALQSLGKRVICYFSGGSWEEWRDDAGDFPKADLGKGLDGWLGERWLNLSSPAVRDVMRARIKLACDKGCDAIDPDNVDGFQNDNGLELTRQDSIDFVRFLSEEASSACNMSTGLKNAAKIIPDVLDVVHFSVNEQCVEYKECETFAPFINDNKPVFHIEYPSGAPDNIQASATENICSQQGDAAGSERFSTVIKKLNLDGWVEYCDGKTFRTQLAN